VRAHEAGALHAQAGHRAPPWLSAPRDVNDLVPQLWSSTAKKTGEGSLVVGGVDVRDLVAEHGSPAYVLDEDDTFECRCNLELVGFDAMDETDEIELAFHDHFVIAAHAIRRGSDRTSWIEITNNGL